MCKIKTIQNPCFIILMKTQDNVVRVQLPRNGDRIIQSLLKKIYKDEPIRTSFVSNEITISDSKELQIYKNTVTNIKDIMSGNEPLDNYEMLSQLSNVLMGHAYYLSELEEG